MVTDISERQKAGYSGHLTRMSPQNRKNFPRIRRPTSRRIKRAPKRGQRPIYQNKKQAAS